jgi:phosphoglycerol transferase MdoB-like AlkP superfamily enzyme
MNIKSNRFNFVQYFAGTLLSAFILEIILESLSRSSLIKALYFLWQEPLLFFLNLSIILLTLSITLFTAKRRFFFSIVAGAWVIIGIVNRIIQCFRLTPVSAMDFYQVKEALKNLPMYMNTINILLLAILVPAVIALSVLLWKKIKSQKRLLAVPISLLAFSCILLGAITFTATRTKVLQNEFDNLRDAYFQYGFAYCFTNSIFERGIDKPSDYSAKRMGEVTDKLENTADVLYKGDKAQVDNPNIIMVQLESFFDVSYLKHYTFSENPLPNFTALKENYTSGFLTVPVYGAGTVNTEFEVITGMSMEYFGTGEYPYRTILKSKTCESVPYNLSREGYRSYVIHNNSATFYDRKDVFPRLGFDNFDSIEFMSGLSYNQLGWAKDSVLTGEILKALKAEEARNYIYTISVQPHGIYPDNEPQVPYKIQVTPESEAPYPTAAYSSLEAYVNSMEYYVNELKETDQFVGELTKALIDYEEPTVIVFYGDHLPPLSLEQKDITNDRHQTEYVLWSNFKLDKEDKDLTAYQLSAYVLDRLGMDKGILTQFHQRASANEDYKEELKLLQYDLLYGKKYVFDKSNPNEVKDMSMGITQPEITEVTRQGDKLLITGSGFTKSSAVVVNNKKYETEYISDTKLSIQGILEEDCNIYVEQLAGSKVTLGKSKAFRYQSAKE